MVSAAPETLILRGTDTKGTRGHPIVFDACLRPEFADLTGDSGGADILRRHKDRIEYVRLPADHATLDLDTPEDWAAYRGT